MDRTEFTRVGRLGLIMLLAGIPTLSHALGLGKLKVNSGLDEPLDAEIELKSLQAGDLDAMQIKLASRREFDEAAIDRPEWLSLLEFTPSRRADGTPYIKVVSDQPVQEPYVQFLLSVQWPSGRVVREYTALLNPPVYADTQGATVSAPVNVPNVATQTPAQSDPAAPTTTAQQPTVAADDGVRIVNDGGIGDFASDYQTNSGDNLWSIASQMQLPEGVSIYQAMLAILRENPQAFINNNMNRMRSNQVLRLPGLQDIKAITGEAARQDYMAQLEAWELYRAALVGAPTTTARPGGDANAEAEAQAVTQAAADADDAAGEASEGEPAADTASDQAATSTDAAAPEDILRIVQAKPAGAADTESTGGDGEIRNDIVRLEEELAARQAENSDLQQQVSELQSQIEKFQRLIELRNSELAQVQQSLTEAETQRNQAQQALTNLEDQNLAGQLGESAFDETDVGAGIDGTQADAGTALDGDTAAEAPLTGAGDVEGEQATTQATTQTTTDAPTQAADADVGDTDVVMDTPTAEGDASTMTPTGVESTDPVSDVEAEADRQLDEILGGTGDDATAAQLADTTTETPADTAADTQDTTLADNQADTGAVTATATPAPRKAEPTTWYQPILDKVTGVFGDMTTAILGLGTLLIAGLAALLYYFRRRKSIAEFEESILSGSALDIQTETTETGATTGATDTSFLSEFGVPGMGTMQADEVDPVAEAEVYMAYGRDEQAEEVLKEAIARDGSRPELKLKLLEIYQQRNDLKEFETLAEELYPADGEETNPVWDKVVAMGQKMNPDNPLFKGGALAAAAAATGAAVAAQDRDDDASAAIDAMSDSSMGDSLSPFPTPDSGSDDEQALSEMAEQAERTHPRLDPFRQEEDATAANDLESEELDLGFDFSDSDADLADLDLDSDLVADQGMDDPLDAGSEDGVAEDSDGIGLGAGLAAAAGAAVTAGALGGSDDAEGAMAESGDLLAEFDSNLGDTQASIENSIEAIDLNMGDAPAEADSSFDLSLGDTDVSDAVSDASEGVDLNLGEIDDLNLDFEHSGDAAQVAPATGTPELSVVDGGAGDDGAEEWTEAATKLDLAKAYIDMGDRSGAQSIIQEVLKEGNEGQRQEAQELADQLAATG